MTDRGPRGPRGRGRGGPARGRGDGGSTSRGTGHGTGANPQNVGPGGAPFRRLGDDEHTPGPKIFRFVLHSH